MHQYMAYFFVVYFGSQRILQFAYIRLGVRYDFWSFLYGLDFGPFNATMIKASKSVDLLSRRQEDKYVNIVPSILK